MKSERRTIPRVVADLLKGDATEAERLAKADPLIRKMVYSSMPWWARMIIWIPAVKANTELYIKEISNCATIDEIDKIYGQIRDINGNILYQFRPRLRVLAPQLGDLGVKITEA